MYIQFAFRWMNCLLMRELPLRAVVRAWDTYLAEDNGFESFHVYVSAALLCHFSATLREMDFQSMVRWGIVVDFFWGVVVVMVRVGHRPRKSKTG